MKAAVETRMNSYEEKKRRNYTIRVVETYFIEKVIQASSATDALLFCKEMYDKGEINRSSAVKDSVKLRCVNISEISE